jgi:hypothetical protein
MIAGSLAACQWGTPGENKPAITTDTLQYTYKEIKQKEAGYEKKPDSECVYTDISYPVFSGQKALNDSIISKILADYSEGDTTIHQFIKNYLFDQKTDPNHPDYIRHCLELGANVIRQDSSILLIEIEGDYFEARRHLNTVPIIHFLNWNTKKGKSILLSDILANNYSNELNKIAETIFRKDEKLSATESLKDYRFEDGKFMLNDNFLITPIGLRFVYNRGDIKLGRADQTEILIPYSQIESLLRPNTVVTQYYK